MSGKTKWAKLAALRRREDCYFIGDKSKTRYHSKYCPLIDQIVKNDLVACGYNPEFLGFRPCPHCSPSPLPSPPKAPKRLPIGELLVEKAAKYGMNAKLSGPNIYLTTVADEWFFNFTAVPIKLRHKNLEERTDRNGRPQLNHYHIQPNTFTSPLEALTYIYRHTEAATNRALSSTPIQLTLSRTPDGLPQLLCDGVSLHPGSHVEALFPDGWHPITLGLRDMEDELLCWYITTPAYSQYSPIGLFVRI